MQGRSNLHERVHHDGIEVRALGLDDVCDRFFVRHRCLIQLARDDRVVDVDDGHDPARDRDGVAAQPFGIARAVPPFVVRVDDVLGDRQRHIIAYPRRTLGVFDHIASVSRMPPHLGELLRSQMPGLVQNAVGHADLADVMQGRQACQ